MHTVSGQVRSGVIAGVGVLLPFVSACYGPSPGDCLPISDQIAGPFIGAYRLSDGAPATDAETAGWNTDRIEFAVEGDTGNRHVVGNLRSDEPPLTLEQPEVDGVCSDVEGQLGGFPYLVTDTRFVGVWAAPSDPAVVYAASEGGGVLLLYEVDWIFE